MKNRLLGKSIALSTILLFLGTSIVPGIHGTNEEVNSVNYESSGQKLGSIINDSVLDLQYIYNLTENLSNIIFTEYDESTGEIAKGRAFGTKGEHKAAEILYENMTKLGLYTWKEPIENIPEYPYVASNIEISERSLTVINKITHSVKPVTDYYISPRGNLTYFNIYLDELKGKKPLLGSILTKLITSLIIPIKGSFDRKYNLYDFDRLTHNFSYKSLKVIRVPSNYSLAMDLVRYIKNDDPFVFIQRDHGFSTWPSGEKTDFKGFLYKTIFKIMEVFHGPTEPLIWTLFHPNCKGIIKVDSNNDTYNMGPSYAFLPVIKVNRTIGEEIYNNPENYSIDFFINQRWNQSVESYNVIGQLNGTNPDETIIVCSLYDSWWCQGTGDAAIAMSMVLGLAKYFKDHNIVPRCNVKFIGFCGEEYGLRGAYHYEATHRKENISFVIDLNQLGFTPLIPENLKFQIWTNNKTLNATLGEFAEETNYTKRTGIGFQMRYNFDAGPSNVHAFCYNVTQGKRICNTLLILKTGYEVPGPQWLNHHRDGLKHTEGDAIKYFNWTDTSISGEMIWNVTEYFTVDNPFNILTDYLYKRQF